MTHRYVQQPNGKYAVWSSVVGDFIMSDLSAHQLREWYVGRETVKAYEHIDGVIGDWENGERPYRSYPKNYEDCIEHRERLQEN